MPKVYPSTDLLILNSITSSLSKFPKNKIALKIISDLATLTISNDETIIKLRVQLRGLLHNMDIALGDAAYVALLALAEFKPRNTEDVISSEMISEDDRIYVSTGMQWSLIFLIHFHNVRPYRTGENLSEGKWLLDPSTNDPFDPRDVAHIKAAVDQSLGRLVINELNSDALVLKVEDDVDQFQSVPHRHQEPVQFGSHEAFQASRGFFQIQDALTTALEEYRSQQGRQAPIARGEPSARHVLGMFQPLASARASSPIQEPRSFLQVPIERHDVGAPQSRVWRLRKYRNNYEEHVYPALSLSDILATTEQECENLQLAYPLVAARLISIDEAKKLLAEARHVIVGAGSNDSAILAAFNAYQRRHLPPVPQLTDRSLVPTQGETAPVRTQATFQLTGDFQQIQNALVASLEEYRNEHSFLRNTTSC